MSESRNIGIKHERKKEKKLKKRSIDIYDYGVFDLSLLTFTFKS